MEQHVDPLTSKPRRKAHRKAKEVSQVVVVSDTHCGCQFGLCPPEVRLDGGGFYRPDGPQATLWDWWGIMQEDWIPRVTQGEPWHLVLNGDALEGRHHGSTTQISQNLADQHHIAVASLSSLIAACKASGGDYFHIRGTEAHVGQTGENEEKLAVALGAKADKNGRFSRPELWLSLNGFLAHFNHHIGTTGSSAYEATAVYKELVEGFVEGGRRADQPPSVIVRSHRHRYLAVGIATDMGDGEGCDAISVVTPGWQLKTPFAYRIAGARQTQPQIGGVLIRIGEDGPYLRKRVWHVSRPEPES